MSEAQAEVQEQVPVIGKGSPAGWRWFASCRYPDLVTTIRPAQDKTSTQRAIKGEYVRLQRGAKPDQFQGDGELGTNNLSATDRNDSPFWGIAKVYDPGPEPLDGYKDDVTGPREQRLSAQKKQLLRETVDVLRGTQAYARTQQNNEVDRTMQLKELDWDPTPLSGSIKNFTRRGSKSLGKDALKKNVEAPQESVPEAPRVKVPSLGRPRKVAA